MSLLRPPPPRGGRWPAMLAWLSVGLLASGALLLAAAGPAYRLGLLSLGDAFGLLRYGAYAAAGAAGVGLIALIAAALCRQLHPALAGGLVIVAVAGMMTVPWVHWQRAQQAPPIHDITTDTDDPPAFEALVAAREAAPNAVDYPGEQTARQQREAYPDIGPLYLNVPPDIALSAAEAAALDQGWELADVSVGRIEAIATTTWFGFKDDVIIRLRETDDGIRVDVRSASRMGRGDMGANAARVRAYLASLERRVR